MPARSETESQRTYSKSNLEKDCLVSDSEKL